MSTKADLSNLYDTASQKMRLPADQNAMESAILDAGYSGFSTRPRAPWWCSRFCARELRGHIGSVQQGQAPAKGGQAKDSDARRGDMLVRKPEGAEVMEVIKARQAGLEMAAPSFKMQYGEARVLKSEAATADAVFESIGASFRFDEPSYSKDFDDLGAFNVDASLSEMTDAEMEKFGIEPVTEMDMAAIERNWMRSLRRHRWITPHKEQRTHSRRHQKAGLNAEDAFNFDGAMVNSGERGLLPTECRASRIGLWRASPFAAGRSPQVYKLIGRMAQACFELRQGWTRRRRKLVARQIAGAAAARKWPRHFTSVYRKIRSSSSHPGLEVCCAHGGMFQVWRWRQVGKLHRYCGQHGCFKGLLASESPRLMVGSAVKFSRQSDGSLFCRGDH